MIHPNVCTTVGRTPLVALDRLSRAAGSHGATILAKIEARNPGGSVKDRIGVALIEDAERRGRLFPGATIVEPTSGNTGVALAVAAASKGYRLILTMPERMSRERVNLLRYLGAEVELTAGSLMREAVERARSLLARHPDYVTLDQFANPANAEVHRRTTGAEIWSDTLGLVDYFVAGVGTGGTITGVGELLKTRRPGVRIVAVEPARAAVLSGQPPGHHLIQGIGAGFIPPILNRAIIDEVIAVADEDALAQARQLARKEGIMAGISSGAVLAAALRIAARPEARDKRIVVVLADSGERYMSTPLVSELLRP